MSRDTLTSKREVDGCFTESDRDLLDQYFKQLAWIIARRNKIQMRKCWQVETELADGRKVKYTFDITGYIK